MNSQDHAALCTLLDGLTGPARRTAYLKLKAAAVAHKRIQRRLSTPHAEAIRELKMAALLPGAGSGLTEDERRKLRNRMKAARR